MTTEESTIMKDVLKSVEDFTIDFHKMVAGKTEGNLVSSALSAHVVLAMAAYGAKGTTAQQMRQALQLPDKDDAAYQGFQKLIDTLNNTPNIILKLANKIYASDQITVKDEFKKLTETYFRSESEVLNFSKAEESAKTVNQWCVDKTNGKIKEIVDKDDILPDLAMILLNAVYFKGNWKNKFSAERTDMQPFHVDEKTTIQVPTMHIQKKFQYVEIADLNAYSLMLPYENEDLVMELIVPKEIGGLAHIEKNLEKIKHGYGGNKHYKHDIILSLPKFKIESTIDLNQHLSNMGMEQMFSNAADFSGISDHPMKVSKVIQKAFIEVNEEGCEAAAVTAVMMDRCLPPPPAILQVDRPFLYRIFNNCDNMTLFSGRVVTPIYGK